jgi:hypothetical protein
MKINNNYLVRASFGTQGGGRGFYDDVLEWKLLNESKKAYKFESIVKGTHDHWRISSEAYTKEVVFWILKSQISEDGNCKYWIIDEIEK